MQGARMQLQGSYPAVRRLRTSAQELHGHKYPSEQGQQVDSVTHSSIEVCFELLLQAQALLSEAVELTQEARHMILHIAQVMSNLKTRGAAHA